ncbi:retrovirus-related pol polyprotein from transposon TNT 1-94 [Tanacetum coccineum]
MFRINLFKHSRIDDFEPNKQIKERVRTKPIIALQPHVIKKKDVNSNKNGSSSTGVESTTRRKRPQPMSSTKNDRVLSVFKNSCIKPNEVEVEEHHMNLMSFNNQKHMSSECNNINLAIQNDKFEVICATCKKCLITANHDVCVFNFLNGMKSHGKNQNDNVSNIENQMKHKASVKKTENLGSKESLSLLRPRKPRTRFRWLPTGRTFDLNGKLHDKSNTKDENEISAYDNASTSDTREPTNSQFLNSISILGRLSKFVYGTVRFGNDHVAVVLGCGDLQWGNILITWVYFVEDLEHSLFLFVKFYDPDLEVAFRRNTCFVKNSDGVDLLKENHSTNLYTINLHEMTSSSPIYLMARATSTKSCYGVKGFDTINTLAKDNLITGLPKFRYTKDHLFPSCEQGKIRVESIDGKWYILVILDDYSRYTWVYFLKLKDEAPAVKFLKQIQVLPQAPVIFVRTDNGTKFTHQVLKAYLEDVAITHQTSTVRIPQQNRVDDVDTACYTQN